MRNRFSIISIFKSNLTINVPIVFCKPQPLFIHHTHHQVELAHFLINPKIRSTTLFSLKFILSNNISKITSYFFRITLELKLTSHTTRPHNITPVTFRIRLRNCRSRHTPIHSFSKPTRIYKSLWIRRSKFKQISITIRRFS